MYKGGVTLEIVPYERQNVTYFT